MAKLHTLLIRIALPGPIQTLGLTTTLHRTVWNSRKQDSDLFLNDKK
jgi:hypothetical protein